RDFHVTGVQTCALPILQGIEIYRGRPILYSCGDFIDDYAVDPVERNDLSCLFELQIEHTNVSRILLHPVRIARFQVNHAGSEDRSEERRVGKGWRRQIA